MVECGAAYELCGRFADQRAIARIRAESQERSDSGA
jgi:hypothetical protein